MARQLSKEEYERYQQTHSPTHVCDNFGFGSSQEGKPVGTGKRVLLTQEQRARFLRNKSISTTRPDFIRQKNKSQGIT